MPLGDQSTDGAHIFHTNATYLWSPVGNSAYSIVLVVADGQSVTTDLTSVSLCSLVVVTEWTEQYLYT